MESTPAENAPFEALLAEAGWLRALAASLVSDPATADDLVQETWLAALRSPPSADRPLRPWLRTVLENFLRMRRRGSGAREARERERAAPEAHGGEMELVERVEEQRYLAREVLQLDEALRTVLVLRYYEGLSSTQIAKRLGSNENTVRWRMKRGLEQLRERLDRRHGGDRRAWIGLLTPLATPAEKLAPSAAGAGALVAALAACTLLLMAVMWWRRDAPRRDELATPALAEIARATAPAELPAERSSVADQRSPSLPLRPSARAFGRVVDRAGAGVADASVLARAAHDGAQLAEARTDAAGRFELALGPDRRARATPELLVSAPGWLALETHAPLALLDEVDCGELVLAREARVSGRAVDERGRPIEGVEFALEPLGVRWPAEREPPLEEARRLGSLLDASFPRVWSDERGQFEFRELRTGYVRLWAIAPGCETRVEGPLALSAGEVTDVGALTMTPLDPGRVVRGVVLAPSGEPAPGAEVEAARSSLRRPFFTSHAGLVRTRCDEAGRFELALEPGGAYEFAARSQGALGVATHLVGSEEELIVALRLAPPLRLSWRSAPAPADQIELVLRDSADGRELLREVVDDAAGEAVLLCDHVRAFDVVARRGFEAARLNGLDPGEHAQALRLEFASAPQVWIEVRANGAPVEGAEVELLEPLDEPQAWRPSAPRAPLMRRDVRELEHARATTDSRGLARVALDVPRRVRARVNVGAHGWPTLLSGAYDAADELRIELALVDSGAIEGVVRGSDGTALVGARVFASQGDGRAWEQLSGADGRYRFESLAPGAWQVRASAIAGADSMLAEVGIERLDRRRAAFDLELHAGETARFDVRAESGSPCQLVGRATLDGAGLGPCVVELTRPGKRAVFARAWLDPAGRFELGCEQSGEFELCIASLARGGARFELRETLSLRSGVQRFDWNHASGVLALQVATPARGARASLSCATASGGSFVLDAPLGADGRAELRALAGEARLEVDGDAGARTVSLSAGRTTELALD